MYRSSTIICKLGLLCIEFKFMEKTSLWLRASEIYNFREVISNFVSRDLKARYKGSILGFFWSFLNPLLNLIILTVVFSFVVRVQVKNFPIFLLIGILFWQFFFSSVVASARSIIDNGGLIKKIYLPREIFPLSAVLANLVNLFVSLVILLVLFLYFKILPTFLWFLLPYFLCLFFVFVFGLSLLVATLSVYFRDVPLLMESVLSAWYFASPIFYPPSLIPERFLKIYFLNPFASFITAFRNILADGVIPSREIFMVTFISALIAISFGYLVFLKLQKKFAEEI